MVQPPSECFGQTSGGRHTDQRVRLTASCFLLVFYNYSPEMHRCWAVDMGETDRRTDGRTNGRTHRSVALPLTVDGGGGIIILPCCYAGADQRMLGDRYTRMSDSTC